MVKTKELPNSKESEMMVLGCMLTCSNHLKIAADILDESDFYFIENKIVFESIRNAYKRNKPSDIHLICEELKRQDKLSVVGGAVYVMTLAQFAGTSAYIERYIELVRNKSILRRLINAVQDIQSKALQDPEDVVSIIDEAQKVFSVIDKSMKISTLPLTHMVGKLLELDGKLEQFRGKKYLGLCQKTIPEIDEKLLGLRKLLLMAAGPNVGKTALTIQLSLDILKNHNETCLVYISLEMSSMDILMRMFCNLSRLDYQTFIFGSNNQNMELMQSAYFTREEWENIEKAKKCLGTIGDRIQIIDASQAEFLDSKKAISFINALKGKTGSKRVIVVIDYLQVWPISVGVKLFTENEMDKWRIGEIKKIRDAINDDPVIVISEARKPSSGESNWCNGLSDVMGSARTTYSPDGVMLVKPLSSEEVCKLINGGILKDKNQINLIEKVLSEKGISICEFEFIKGRDGMQRFSIYLEFQYRKNMFKTTCKERLKIELVNGRK